MSYDTTHTDQHDGLSILSRADNDARYVMRSEEFKRDTMETTNFEVKAESGLNDAAPSLKLNYTAA